MAIDYNPYDEPVARGVMDKNELTPFSIEMIRSHRREWETKILSMTGVEIKSARVSMDEELKRIDEYKRRVIALKDTFKDVLS